MESMAQKLVVLAGFLALFAFAIRKERVLVIPFILLFYSNINGLLDWEDFALKGFIKFQDYGLLIAIGFVVQHALSLNKREPDYMRVSRATALYNVINIFWIYYLVLFAFSVIVQGPVWAIKMARTFFYGLVIYVVYLEVMADPLAKFERLLRFMMWATLFFGCLYILYNLTGLSIYPKGEHEVFKTSYLEDDVRRNFSGFPTFAHFFIFYLVDRLLRGEGSHLLNVIGASILVACVVMMLTRYTLVITFALVLVLAFFRKQDVRTLGRLIAAVIAFAALLPLIVIFAETYYTTLLRRFDEIATRGILASHNLRVRIVEFEQILKNVMDFDPLFGFGFTVPWGLGYPSNVYHAGSADNGYANLLGVTGFFGLFLFLLLMGCWIVINRRLRALEAEHLSRVTFVFILFVLAGMMNNAHAGYMHYIGIFMVYDLFAYGYLKHKMSLTPRKLAATPPKTCSTTLPRVAGSA